MTVLRLAVGLRSIFLASSPFLAKMHILDVKRLKFPDVPRLGSFRNFALASIRRILSVFLLPLSQAHSGAPAVLVDELDAGRF
jgi:hypothetical protein